MRLACLSIAAVLLAPAAADAAKRRPPCSKGGETVAANRLVRVFEKGPRLMACTKSDRDRDVLATSYDDGYVQSDDYGNVRLAGSFVAWTVTSTDASCKAMCPDDYDPTRHYVHVRDVATDDTVWTLTGWVRSLELVETGGVAWLADGELRAMVEGETRLLDSGEISGLEASRTRVSWLNAGELRVAALG